MADLVWEDPPPRRPDHRGQGYDEIAEALKERPGQWALVAEGGGPEGVDAVRKALRRRGFEAVGRGRRGETIRVYARWTGGGSEQQADEG